MSRCRGKWLLSLWTLLALWALTAAAMAQPVIGPGPVESAATAAANATADTDATNSAPVNQQPGAKAPPDAPSAGAIDDASAPVATDAATDDPKPIDHSRLWLPKSYAGHGLALEQAAQSVVAEWACAEVVAGTVLLPESVSAHPVFTIRCRKPDDWRTFAVRVDGLSGELLDTDWIVAPPSPEGTDEGEAVDPEPVTAEASPEQLARYGERCLVAVQRQVANMQQVTGLTAPLAPITTTDTQWEYQMDFDARDPRNQLLRYRARCVVDVAENVAVTIVPRALAEPPPAPAGQD